MKNEKIIHALESIDEKYIIEAAPENARGIRRSRRIRKAVMSSSAVAACFACALAIGIGYYNMPPEPPVTVIDPFETNGFAHESETTPPVETVSPVTIPSPPLPYFDMNDATLGMDFGMGYEAYSVFDISELLPGNAVEVGTFDMMGVYRNKLTYDERMMPSGQDLDGMKEWLLETAEKLGMDTAVLTIKDNVPTGRELERLEQEFAGRYQTAVPDYYFIPSVYSVEDDNYLVEVTADMTLTIRFKKKISIPNEYSCVSSENTEELTSYLWAEYGDMIGYVNPGYFIEGGGYSVNLTKNYGLSFYDMGDEDDKWVAVENAFFDHAHFSIVEGELMLIRIYAFTETVEELAKFPLICREDAEDRLLKGEYYSSILDSVPVKENIHYVGLVYINGSNAKIVVPFYKFYVEIPEKREGDMKFYGAYYVPAVEQPHDSKPTDDMHFNLP